MFIDDGATLQLGGAVAATQTIRFASGAAAILKLDHAGSIAGAIQGFAATDTIDLENLAVTSDKYAGGVLSLFDGATSVASLTVAGATKGQIFALSGDGKGGTNVNLAPDSAPVISVPGAQTVVANTTTPINGVSVSDSDAIVAGQTLTVTIRDRTGAMSATTAGGGAVTGAGSATLAITGSLSQVDADLATLSYTGTKPGTDKISVSANDGVGPDAVTKTISVSIASAPPAASATTAGALALFIQYIAGGFRSDFATIMEGHSDFSALADHHALAASMR
jgi:hypothetical protein